MREVDAEFTNNYEIALRSQWFEDRLTVNANAFFIDWTCQQVFVQNPAGVPGDGFEENAGESRVWGGEIDIRAEPIPGLELFDGVGYAKTEFLDFISNGAQLAGSEFIDAPKWTASFGGTYSFEEGWFVGADASFTGSAFGDVPNTAANESDSRFLVNLRLGYETENFSIFAYADNVLDNDYVLSVNAGALDLLTPGDPRRFGIVGQINF